MPFCTKKFPDLLQDFILPLDFSCLHLDENLKTFNTGKLALNLGLYSPIFIPQQYGAAVSNAVL